MERETKQLESLLVETLERTLEVEIGLVSLQDRKGEPLAEAPEVPWLPGLGPELEVMLMKRELASECFLAG